MYPAAGEAMNRKQGLLRVAGQSEGRHYYILRGAAPRSGTKSVTALDIVLQV